MKKICEFEGGSNCSTEALRDKFGWRDVYRITVPHMTFRKRENNQTSSNRVYATFVVTLKNPLFLYYKCYLAKPMGGGKGKKDLHAKRTTDF